MTESGVAPGWYPDVTERHESRYWDGTSWTADVADRGTQSVDHGDIADATAAPEAAPPSIVAPPPPPSPAPASSAPTGRPRRKGRPATILFWLFGVILLVVGTVGFVGSNNMESYDDEHYATQLTELKGDVSGSTAKATALHTRTAAFASALAAYDASLNEMQSAHNAVIDGLDRAIGQLNSGGSTAIAQNELPALIERFKAAAADQATKQAALVAALTSLQEVTQ